MTLELDAGAGEDGEGGKDVLVTSNATRKVTEVLVTIFTSGRSYRWSMADGREQMDLVH